MCGLFGVIGPGILQSDLEVIKQLGMVSQLRGVEGSGIYQVRSNPYYNGGKHEAMFKSWSPWAQMITNELDEPNLRKLDILNTVQVDTIMCHVRASTRGAICDSNAHPFVCDHIVGAHNGSLKDKKYTESKDLTDSELMFRDMAYEGRDSTDEGIRKVLTPLDKDSAFALSIYDRKAGMMYFVRNELRPLSFAFLEDRAVMYWCSELDMLRYVLKRNGMTSKNFTLNPNNVMKIKPSDITRHLIQDDPLSIFKGSFKITRPIPSIVEKINQKREELEKKKRDEEAKSEEKKSIMTVDGKAKGGWTPDVIVNNTSTANVTPQQVKHTIDSYMPKCACGQFTLNLVAQNRARRGVKGKFKFIKETNQFKCSPECEPQKLPAPTTERAVG